MYNSPEEYAVVIYTIKDVVSRAAQDGIVISDTVAKIILAREGQAIMKDAFDAGLDSIAARVKLRQAGIGRKVDTYA